MSYLKPTALFLAAILLVGVSNMAMISAPVDQGRIDGLNLQLTVQVDPEKPSAGIDLNLGDADASANVDLSPQGGADASVNLFGESGSGGGGGNGGGGGGNGGGGGGNGGGDGGNSGGGGGGGGGFSDGFFGFFRSGSTVTSSDVIDEAEQVGPLAALGDFIEANWMILLVIIAVIALLLLISRREVRST